MSGLRRRLDRLERSTPPPPMSPRPTLLEEIRAVEAEIAALEAEMRAEGMSEAEIRATYEEPPLSMELEGLKREIGAIEAGEE